MIWTDGQPTIATPQQRPTQVEPDRLTEPALATGTPEGDPDGIGRGELTERQLRRLEFIAYRTAEQER